MKKLMLTMLIVGVAAVAAHASVSVDVQAFYTYADNGSTHLPTNSLVAFIVDIDGDGFGDMSTLTGGSFTVDDDDVLLGTMSTGETGAGYIWNSCDWDYVASQGAEGHEFAMIWFDTAYSEGATGAGEGVAYGVYETGDNVPADGTSGEVYQWWTSDMGGELANDTFYANYTTSAVPEPATIALLIAGGAAALARRKRRG